MDLPQKIHVYHSILYSGKKAGVFIYLFAKDKEVPIIDYRYGTCILNGGCCSDATIVVYNNVMCLFYLKQTEVLSYTDMFLTYLFWIWQVQFFHYLYKFLLRFGQAWIHHLFLFNSGAGLT